VKVSRNNRHSQFLGRLLMGAPNLTEQGCFSDKKGHLFRPIKHFHLLENLVKSDKFEYFSVSALDLLVNKQAFCMYSTTKPNSEQPGCGEPRIPLGLQG
jgi:hypothetical protein